MKCGGQLFSTTVVPPRLLCHRRTCQWWDNKGVCSPWLFFFFSCLGRYGWGTQSVFASLPYPPVVWPQLLSRRTATGPGVVHAPVHHCFCSTFSVSPRYLALLCNLSQKLQKKKKKELQMTGEKRWGDQEGWIPSTTPCEKGDLQPKILPLFPADKPVRLWGRVCLWAHTHVGGSAHKFLTPGRLNINPSPRLFTARATVYSFKCCWVNI